MGPLKIMECAPIKTREIVMFTQINVVAFSETCDLLKKAFCFFRYEKKANWTVEIDGLRNLNMDCRQFVELWALNVTLYPKWKKINPLAFPWRNYLLLLEQSYTTMNAWHMCICWPQSRIISPFHGIKWTHHGIFFGEIT